MDLALAERPSHEIPLKDHLGVHYSHALQECPARAEHIFTPFCIPGSLTPPFH